MRGRLVAAGIIAFAVILGSCLAYLAVHPYHWTLDPVRPGGLPLGWAHRPARAALV